MTSRDKSQGRKRPKSKVVGKKHGKSKHKSSSKEGKSTRESSKERKRRQEKLEKRERKRHKRAQKLAEREKHLRNQSVSIFKRATDHMGYVPQPRYFTELHPKATYRDRSGAIVPVLSSKPGQKESKVTMCDIPYARTRLYILQQVLNDPSFNSKLQTEMIPALQALRREVATCFFDRLRKRHFMKYPDAGHEQALFATRKLLADVQSVIRKVMDKGWGENKFYDFHDELHRAMGGVMWRGGTLNAYGRLQSMYDKTATLKNNQNTVDRRKNFVANTNTWTSLNYMYRIPSSPHINKFIENRYAYVPSRA